MLMERARMLRYFSLIYLNLLLLGHVSGDNVVQETIGPVRSPEMLVDEFDHIHPDMEKLIGNVEALAGKLDPIGDMPEEESVKIYEDMIDAVDEIIEAVGNSNNAYSFLNLKGLDRIVHMNLKIKYDSLKARLLFLLKVLFEVTPTTTNAVIPITVVDRLLDIFENDNLALKAHALDILYVWLPENPRLQARVMKIKGLAPFYDQVGKLDTSVIKNLLDLFNTILKEHLKARNDNLQKNAIDADKMKFYLRIGLLEHMSTPVVCNGLMNIFTKTWSYNTADNNVIVTVLDIIKNIQPFCTRVYRGKGKPKKLFSALQEYVNDPENLKYFESNGVNVTDVSLVIAEYVQKLNVATKDEM